MLVSVGISAVGALRPGMPPPDVVVSFEGCVEVEVFELLPHAVSASVRATTATAAPNRCADLVLDCLIVPPRTGAGE
jgi:hypothetical protein